MGYGGQLHIPPFDPKLLGPIDTEFDPKKKVAHLNK